MIKTILSSKFLIAGGMCFFGATVHVSNASRLARKSGQELSRMDMFALYVSALFSGMVFGITALLLSGNELHFMLAVSIGSFLGLTGLTKITDIILSVLTRSP